MIHHTTVDFWDCYNNLPKEVQRLADENYALLRSNSRPPSLHFKRVGRLWSVRVGIGFRALALDGDAGPNWFWIGSHAEYNRIIQNA